MREVKKMKFNSWVDHPYDHWEHKGMHSIVKKELKHEREEPKKNNPYYRQFENKKKGKR